MSKSNKMLHWLTIIDTSGVSEDILMFDDLWREKNPKANNYYVLNFKSYFDRKNNIERFNVKSFDKIDV